MNSTTIECPYCHKQFKSLLRHVPYVHGITMEAFREQYPNMPVQVGVYKDNSLRAATEQAQEAFNKYKEGDKFKCPYCDKLFKRYSGLSTHCLQHHGKKLPSKKDFIDCIPKEKDFICKFCDESFKDYRGLHVHYAMKHKDEWDSYKESLERTEEEGFLCPICNKVYVGLADHVRCTHRMEWDDFVKEYNWVDGGTFMSSSHRKHLSRNKKQFYKTERGLELRKQTSLIVSESIKNCTSSDACRSYYFFWKDSNGNDIRLRSFTEFSIMCYLKRYGISYEYEPFFIHYKDADGRAHRYLPDLLIDNVLYEIKSDTQSFDSCTKYEFIKKTLKSTFYKLELLTPKMCYDIFGKPFMSKEYLEKCLADSFWKNSTFRVEGKFIENYNNNQRSALLMKVFSNRYEDFEKENLKRIRLHETEKNL